MRQHLFAQVPAFERAHLVPRRGGLVEQFFENFLGRLRVLFVLELRHVEHAGEERHALHVDVWHEAERAARRGHLLAVGGEHVPVDAPRLEVLRPEHLHAELHLAAAEGFSQILVEPRLPSRELPREAHRYFLIAVIDAGKLYDDGPPFGLYLGAAEAGHAYVHTDPPFKAVLSTLL